MAQTRFANTYHFEAYHSGCGDYVARLVGFRWRDAQVAYEFLRWSALAVLLVAGWGMWYRLSNGAGVDPVTLAVAIGSMAVGLLRPAVLREVVNWGAPVAACLVATCTPAPSDRPAMRAEEIGALSILAATCAAAAHAARDRACTVVARVLSARSVTAETLHPRLAAALVAGSLRFNAA